MVPGLTELTRMPRPMSSPEGVRAIEAMPALVAQLETWLGPPKAGRPDLSRGERGAGIDPAGAVLLPIIDQDTTQLGVQHLSIDR
jgi:hypothetical protein